MKVEVSRPKRNSTCHPDKPHYSLGLCKTCYSNHKNSLNRQKLKIKAKDYRCRNKDAIEDRRLKKKYGISLEEYKRKKEAQNGKCAICGLQANHLDHHHDKNIVRHFLCYRCNSGIGYFKDNVELLQKTISYLKEFE